MAQMGSISNYIIGVIMFCFFIVGGLSLIAILSNSDSTLINNSDFTRFNQTVNKFDVVQNKVIDINKSINQDSSTSTGLIDKIGYFDSLIGSSFNTLKLITGSFSFMGDAMNNIGLMFGVPGWVFTTIMLIIVVIIVFAIYGALFRSQL